MDVTGDPSPQDALEVVPSLSCLALLLDAVRYHGGPQSSRTYRCLNVRPDLVEIRLCLPLLVLLMRLSPFPRLPGVLGHFLSRPYSSRPFSL